MIIFVPPLVTQTERMMCISSKGVGGAGEAASQRVYPAEGNRRGRETSKPESIPRRRKLAGQGSKQVSEYTPPKETGGAGEQASQ